MNAEFRDIFFKIMKMLLDSDANCVKICDSDERSIFSYWDKILKSPVGYSSQPEIKKFISEAETLIKNALHSPFINE